MIFLFFGAVSGINLGAFNKQLSACLTPRPRVSKATRPQVQLKRTETEPYSILLLQKKKNPLQIIEKISKADHNTIVVKNLGCVIFSAI